MKLILFFNGWGMDENSISHIEEGKDFKLINIYDYKNYDFNKLSDILLEYEEVIVIGYSFGVFFANNFIEKYNIKYKEFIAINGSSKMIDNSFGIVERTFDYTLKNLTQESLQKFYINIGYNGLSERKFENIKEELEFIKSSYEPQDFSNITKLIISKEDKIFKYKNQINFKNSLNKIEVIEVDENHYPFYLWNSFEEILDLFYKESVKSSFQKSLNTYEKYAGVQKKVSENLFKNVTDKNYKNILEIGSFTGILTKKLSDLHYENLYLNDIVDNREYISKLNLKNTNYLIGDIEKIEISEKFDLVISSSTIQWIKNTKELFSKIYNTLEDEGQFMFSTYIEGNLKEVEDHTCEEIEYKSLEKLKTELEENNFIIKSASTEEIELKFKSSIDLLKHFKYTGTNTKKNKLNYSEIRNFDRTTLTYKACYIVAQKMEVR